MRSAFPVFLACLGFVTPVHATDTGPPASEVASIASRVGLSPEILAAAGLHASATTCLQRLNESLDLRAQLAQSDSVRTTVGATLTTLYQQVSNDPDNETAVGECAAAQAELNAATQAVLGIVGALRQEALGVFTAEERGSFDLFHTASQYNVPVEFGARERSSDDWGRIEVALRAEARSLRFDEELAPEYGLLLASVRSEAVVLAAQQSLMLHLQDVQLAFDAFEGQP